MTQQISLIPESAPFNEEQRAWLNGFLAGWIGLQGGDGASSTSANAITAAPQVEVEEEFPWHDPALPMEDRLQLAEGKPLPRQLMAAMAQLDCGSCGYDCKRYAEAIANGEEKSLTLCSPGGKPTSRKLKELVSLGLSSNGHSANPTNGAAAVVKSGEPKWNRNHPFAARIRHIRNLNEAGSSKHTSHVEIDLSGSGLTYDVGDALGVYPCNCPELVQGIVGELHATGDELIDVDGQQLTLNEALRDHFCLSEITDELITSMSECCGDVGDKALLKQLLDDADPIDGWDVLELLKYYSTVRLTAQQLTSSLSRLKPRLYSISSSLKAHPEQVHLTVGRVHWQFQDRGRKGVASTMFSDRMAPGDSVRVFVQTSHGFSVPKDPDAPAIMIGPGTGIAPFRAFLQERHATQASGKNWLFFGDQRSQTDYLYRDELESLYEQGVLSRIDLAFSRDQSEKVYVQDRMLENGAEFWAWLEAGGHVYVCGDANRMAVDVDKALKRIVSEFGGLGPYEADKYLARMAKDKRYCRDVY
ncbi:sulfite reductase subunit alpha [Planctomicrobium piriforme]|uniref:assimilatory sulfite reductase (NADPH) n=1 Tax=Planctomicrobium piriforme TaxID=1576369 RepID=A0A1I3QG17_9PLAN|nr:sulfite reductase subunit alpha [Planctomicrobium piriforme]SFJ32928.1 sulfite reductase (NADPH) flavoprotein alpha-component [Planctomicrobium piriforme]